VFPSGSAMMACVPQAVVSGSCSKRTPASRTDAITAMSLATGSAALAQALSQGGLTFEQTADEGQRWARAHGLLV